MRLFNPLRQFPDRMDVFRVTGSLLAERVEDPVILPLEVLIDPYGEPAEDDSDSDTEAEAA